MAVQATNYSFSVQVPWSPEETIERVTAELKEEGFGVLTTIDVQATLKEKIGAETEPYVVLGACNPRLAHQAIGAEPEIGVLLPCNVIVYQSDGQTRVAAMDPQAALSLTENPDVEPLAREVKGSLERVISRLV